SSATQTIINIIIEVNTHKTFCAQWDVDEAELATTAESPSTTAYGAYLLDVKLSGDSTKLITALAAYLLRYGEIGLWLKKEAAKPDSWGQTRGQPVMDWIERQHSGEICPSAVPCTLDTIETLAAADPPSEHRFRECCAVWEKCTRLEKGFWGASLRFL
ncbi:hypothetical protein C8Q74DRAFT_1187267, partial [Fomes fomentarius]